MNIQLVIWTRKNAEIKQFVSECCLIDKDAVTQFKDLFLSFQSWAKSNQTVATRRRLGLWLSKNGFIPGFDRGRFYQGIRLKS